MSQNRLVEAGRATPDAVFRARADRSAVEQRLAEARDDEDAAARAFNQVLRRSLAAPVDEVPDSVLRFEITVTEDAALAQALVGSEELAQAAAGVGAAEAGVRLATASLIPNVALAIDYGFQGGDLSFGGDQSFTVAIPWCCRGTCCDRRAALARRGEHRPMRNGSAVRRAELEDLVRLDVTRAYRAAVVARDAIVTAETGLAAARRSLEAGAPPLREGARQGPVEHLDVRLGFTDAELNRVITVYRYASRYVDLERAAALRELEYDANETVPPPLKPNHRANEEESRMNTQWLTSLAPIALAACTDGGGQENE